MAVIKMSIVWAIKHHALEQQSSNKTLELLDIFMTQKDSMGFEVPVVRASEAWYFNRKHLKSAFVGLLFQFSIETIFNARNNSR